MPDKLILITNDDGINAPGIRFLIDCLKPLARIIVVAPMTPMSGMGHAVTIREPLRLKQVLIGDNIAEYKTNGTPVDCVKLAMNVLPNCKPDLIVSGINHGSNASVNVFYSGTMAAVIEGCMLGIPSIGFSSVNYAADVNFSGFADYIKRIVVSALETGIPDHTCLNVNFPETEIVKGLKVCRQAMAYWKEDFDERIDPHDSPYFWLRGQFVMTDSGDDHDEACLAAGYVSVVPINIDITAHNALESLKKQFNSL